MKSYLWISCFTDDVQIYLSHFFTRRSKVENFNKLWKNVDDCEEKSSVDRSWRWDDKEDVVVVMVVVVVVVVVVLQRRRWDCNLSVRLQIDGARLLGGGAAVVMSQMVKSFSAVSWSWARRRFNGALIICNFGGVSGLRLFKHAREKNAPPICPASCLRGLFRKIITAIDQRGRRVNHLQNRKRGNRKQGNKGTGNSTRNVRKWSENFNQLQIKKTKQHLTL